MLMTLLFCDFDNVKITENAINDELIKFTECLACNELSLNLAGVTMTLFRCNYDSLFVRTVAFPVQVAYWT